MDKEKKIIYELWNDGRISTKKLAQKLNIQSTYLHTKRNNIEKSKIDGFITTINWQKLGQTLFRIYIELTPTSSKLRKELVSELLNITEVQNITINNSPYHMIVPIHVNSIYDVTKIILQIKKKCAFIKKIDLKIVDQHYQYTRDYLLNKNKSQEIKLTRNNSEIIQLDSKNKKIIELLENNGNMKIIKMSEMLNIDVNTIKRRIQKLKAENIITGFRPQILLESFEIKNIKVIFRTNTFERLYTFLRKHTNVISLWKFIDGDLECAFEYIQKDDFKVFISEIEEQFHEEINEISYFENQQIIKKK